MQLKTRRLWEQYVDILIEVTLEVHLIACRGTPRKIKQQNVNYAFNHVNLFLFLFPLHFVIYIY
jgi:hypothetical protein